MKSLAVGLTIATSLMTFTSIEPVQASDCTNYWTNPSTGQQECLGQELQIINPPQVPATPRIYQPATEQDFFETSDISDFSGLEEGLTALLKGLELNAIEGSATGLVQHLKNCQPYRYSFAMAFMPEMAISQNVIGDRNGNCAVNVTVETSEMNTAETVARCQFTPSSIAILTDDLAYAEAQALDSNNWDAIEEIPPERGSAIYDRECQATS